MCILEGSEAEDIRYHEGCEHTLATQLLYRVPLELLTGTDGFPSSHLQSSESSTSQRRQIDSELLKYGAGKRPDAVN